MEEPIIITVRVGAKLRDDLRRGTKATKTDRSTFLRALMAFGARETVAGRAAIENGILILK